MAASTDTHALGAAMAVATALAWSGAVLLLRRGAHFGASPTNLFKNAVGTTLMLPTLAVAGVGGARAIPAGDLVILAISGTLGIAIGDTLFLGALRRLGAGWMALLDCIYAPTVVLVAIGWLGEPVGPSFVVGAALVVAGLLVAAWQPQRSEPVAAGLLMGLGSIVVVALAVVMAKPVLDRSELVAATTVRLGAGTLAQALALAAIPGTRASFRVFADRRAWRELLPAAVLGTWLSMLLWLGGLKYTHASVAALLNQLATVFLLLGARFVLHEAVPPRRWVGALVAATGAVVIAWR